MPRTARTLVDGAYYHVVNRGLDRRDIFQTERDLSYFLLLTSRYLKKFKIAIMHYCLMPNHFHFLIHAHVGEDLPRFMHGLLQEYARYYRTKHEIVGYLFQNRYRSKVIENSGYLLSCGRYIERNPLRAEVADDIASYPWSSFRFYAKGEPDSVVTEVDPLYVGLADTPIERQRKFYRYVLEESFCDDIIDAAFKVR